MKAVYASKTGNVEKVINKLGITDALKLNDGSERFDGDYVIFTYTFGNGITPVEVEKFLKANPGVKAVVSSGNSVRHPNTFNFAADNISKAYNVPIIAKLEGEGTDEDIEHIRAELAKL